MIHLLDLAGTAVFAVSGALAGGRRRLDLFGVVVLALVTAIGGGTVRDLVLGFKPVFWVGDPMYLYIGIAAAIVAFFYARFAPEFGKALVICDAFGLAIFTVVGAQKALAAGYGGLIVVLMGMTTGVAGGIMRDVLCAEVPLILRKEIYATASLAGGLAFVALLGLRAPEEVAIVAAVVIVLAMRLAAIRWGLALPVLGARDTDKGTR